MNTIPKIDIVPSPTPLEYLAGVSEDLGVHFYIKREDMTGLGVGGNKLRKLQYLLADAKAQGATMLLTVGGAQTNHGRLTAAVAAKYGMKCAIVSEDVYPGEISSNILLDRIMGADVVLNHSAEDKKPLEEMVQLTIERYEAAGEKVYYIPMGGSNAIGAMGYVEVAKETTEQALAMGLEGGTFVTTVGSLGTYTGLFAGLREINAPFALKGVTIAPFDPPVREAAAGLFRSLKDFAGLSQEDPSEEDFDIETDYDFGAYNNPVGDVRKAIYYMGRREGIILDPCYTGKTFLAICKMVHDEVIAPGSNVIFFHTGGVPGIHGPVHRKEFERELRSGITLL